MNRRKAVVVMGLVMAAMLCAQSFAITGETRTVKNEDVMKEMDFVITKLNTPIPTTNQGNVLISANSPEDDFTPTIAVDNNGRIVVAYTHQLDVFDSAIMLAYSTDNGNTWTASAGLALASGGLLHSPDMVNIPAAGEVGLGFLGISEGDFVWGWRIADISGDPETWSNYPYSWLDSENYEYLAVGYVDVYFLIMNTDDSHGLTSCPALGYWGPDFSDPPNIGGGYYDGQSILKTAPASNLDMATGLNRMYMVMQHDNETTGHSEIAWKATVTDLDLLFTPGGGPGGMDKYADIEVWPWQGYLGKGDFDSRDPEIAASGTNVVVVYMCNDNVFGDWDIKCAYSNDEGDTWSVSTVVEEHPADEMYPSVYMSGNSVYVVYVKDGNLYLVKSTDGGATWGEPKQINDVDGTVVAEENAVEIDAGGIVWTDTRNGNRDIYYAPLPAPLITIDVSGGFGVKATISNTGSEAAENVDWSIDLSGLVFLGKHAEGTIPSLAPGESTTVSPGFVLGIGPTTVTVTAGGVTKTASGFVLGPLVLGLS